MLKIGLTGVIGSGKSTVAKVFEALGVPVFYSDAEAKKIIHTNKEVIAQIIQSFGEDSYKDGIYQTAYIAGKVFNNSTLLEKLNSVVHPKVGESFAKWCREHKTEKYVIKESALIFQLGLNKTLDFVILVNADEEAILNRVIKRDKISKDEVKVRLNKQLASVKETAKADFIIQNNNDSEVLPQILKIHEAIISKAN